MRYSILLIIFLSLTTHAQAYVDPGSASLIIQAIIGVIAGALATIKLWWKKFIGLFSRKKIKRD
tara:strand:+ start:405 stop:596 length:192 start_codon:yes stop_codon:yes gene_type:complete